MTHFLNIIRDYADAHPGAVFVIAASVSLFSLVFVSVLELIDLRRQHNEARFQARKDAMLARLTREKQA